MMQYDPACPAKEDGYDDVFVDFVEEVCKEERATPWRIAEKNCRENTGPGS